ncbi:MAG: DUF721 domain-containing protein [Nitrospinota bacterium]|nr:DUF721 domain-containing protein [Nitrospinota bacterium]MDH5757501.1 DUF721 domain-containing protein [Nitrospinota bacterium]
MRRKKQAPSHIGQVLESLSASMGKRELYDFAAISGNWRRIVGPVLDKVSSPVRISRKTLTIDVAQPVWIDSMGYMKKEIIQKVNAVLGQHMVSRIRMTVRQGSPENAGTENQEKLDLTNVPLAAQREAEEAVKHIKDSQLRSDFKRIILKDVCLKYYLPGKKTKP